MSHRLGSLVADRYLLNEIIGSGGAGTVFKATQKELSRTVALKMLLPKYSKNTSFRRRFVREARAIARLSHPNIAIVHDFGRTKDDQLYLVMEYVKGLSLKEIFSGIVLPFARIHQIFDQILAGLAHAHARGVIHRDIKPENILVSQDVDNTPLVKIVDFGIAQMQGLKWSDNTSLTGDGNVIGTPYFMAPEQARGKRDLTDAVDIYAVGLMLYWALSGKYAFSGETAIEIISAQIHQPPPPLLVRKGILVPEGIVEIIQKALQKKPNLRVKNATSFRKMMKKTMEQTQNLKTPDCHSIEKTRVRVSGALPCVDRAPSIPLIGRKKERNALNQTFAEVKKTGFGRIVTIEGGAGVGKSTLARAWKEEIFEKGEFRFVSGNFHREGDRGMRGVREIFENLLGVRGIVAHQVENIISEMGFSDSFERQLLHDFLRPHFRDKQEFTRRPQALYEILLRVLERHQPLFLLIRALHWAGPETAAFLEFLADELIYRPCKILFVVTAQKNEKIHPNIAAALKHIGRYQGQSVLRIHLTDLSPEMAAELVKTLVDAKENLVQSIIDRAGGNPMYLVQLTRYLFERELIEQTNEGWLPKKGIIVEDVLPPTLADVVQLRIEQLDQQAGNRIQKLLERAAIAGRRFRFAVLERILELEKNLELLQHLDDDIDRILDEHLLKMTEKRNDDILAFKTSLVHDVVLEHLKGRRKTRKLHKLAADAKIAVLGQNVRTFAAELAKHYQYAREPEKEYEYTCIAADNAQQSHRPADASKFLQSAISLLETNAIETENQLQTLQKMYLRTAKLNINAGEYSKAFDFFSKTLNSNNLSPILRIESLLGSAYVTVERGNFQAGELFYLKGTELAKTHQKFTFISQGLLGQSRVAWHRGDTSTAQKLAEKALFYAHQANEPICEPNAIWFIGVLANGRGELENARTLFIKAIKIYQKLNVLTGIAKCKSLLAANARLRNDLTTATEFYKEALQIYTNIGARRGVAHQLNGLGDVARFRSDFVAARAYYRRAVGIFQSIRIPFDAAIALTNLGLVAHQAHDLLAARDAFQRALRVSIHINYPYLILGSKLNLAWVVAELGDENRSNLLLKEALSMVENFPRIDPDYALPLEKLGELKAAAGKLDEAHILYEHAYKLWSELGRKEELRRLSSHLNEIKTNKNE